MILIRILILLFPIFSSIALSEFVINPKINGVDKGIGFEGFFAIFYSISTILPEDYEPFDN